MKINSVVMKQIEDILGKDHGISVVDQALSHGNSVIVTYTRTYVGMDRRKVTEYRVALFQHVVGAMYKANDVVAGVGQ